jgi:dipeptidyl aminopeptidase/acylaminoacyl peptidase
MKRCNLKLDFPSNITLLLLALLIALLAGCSQSQDEPLYALASHDVNGDGLFDDQTPGEEAPAIYQINIDGDEVSMGRLTNPSEYIPKWFKLSPDRSKLAFTTQAIPDIGELLYIKDLTSSAPPEQVLADTFQIHGLYWSRDGEHLAAIVTDSINASKVLYITPDGVVERTGDVQLFAENEMQDYSPLVAPNLSKRLWPKGVEGGFLYTQTGPVDEPGDDDPVLTKYPMTFVGWSPDSEQILLLDSTTDGLEQFGQLTEPHGALYKINPDGSDLKALTASGGATAVADWSPDGRTIAYLTQLEDSDNDGKADSLSDLPLLYLLSQNSTARRISLGNDYRLDWGIDW